MTELEKQARELLKSYPEAWGKLSPVHRTIAVQAMGIFAAQVRAQTIEECERIVSQFEGCDGLADLIHSLIGQIRAIREREK